MHELIERGLAREVHGSQCISYILENDSLFSLSEYKVLKNQTTSFFVDLAKITYNGKIKLTYFLEEYISLKSLAPSMDGYRLLSIVAEILDSVLEVVNNGYLDVANLNIETNRIYVKPAGGRVKFIYLPVNVREQPGTVVLKKSPIRELRTNLATLISTTPNAISAKTRELCGWLSNELMSLEEILARIRGNAPNRGENSINFSGNGHTTKSAATENTACLRLTNSNEGTEFKINTEQFVLGRSESEVDGYISFNPAVGRIHCKIVRTKNGFAVEDLNSKNGTYVNKMRLKPNQRKDISDGDIIRLANSDFVVSIIEGK